jgi:hypothetical protein
MNAFRRWAAGAALILLIGGSANSVAASCLQFATSDNGDGTCTTCYFTGSWTDAETGKRFCSYECSIEKCYTA